MRSNGIMVKTSVRLLPAWLAWLATPALLGAGIAGQSATQQLAGSLVVLVFMVCLQLGLLAVCLVYAVLDPRQVELGSRLQRQAPLKSFVVGVVAFVILLLLAAIFAKLHPPRELAALVWLPLLCVYAYLLVTGFAMTAHGIGERIQSNLNSRALGSSFLAVLYGGGVLLCVNFLLILGQVLLFVAGLISLGSAVRVLFVRNGDRGGAATDAVDKPPPVSSV